MTTWTWLLIVAVTALALLYAWTRYMLARCEAERGR